MENNKKRFGALDWVILIVLLLCAAVFALRLGYKDQISGDELMSKYAISFSITDVRHTTVDAFVKGDKVYVATDDTYIGIFDRIDSNNPAAYYVENSDTKVYYPQGTRVDLMGTLISEGVMNDDGFFAGGSYFLAPGKKLTIYTGHVFVDIVLTDIYEYDE